MKLDQLRFSFVQKLDLEAKEVRNKLKNFPEHYCKLGEDKVNLCIKIDLLSGDDVERKIIT